MTRFPGVKTFNNLTLWKKLTLIIVALFLSIIVIGVNLTSRMNREYFDRIINITDTSVNQLKGNLVERLKDDANVIAALIDNKPFSNYLSKTFASDYDAYALYIDTVDPLLRSLEQSNTIRSFGVYSNNATLRISHITNNLVQDLDKETWFDKRSLSSGGFNWVVVDRASSQDARKTLCCYKTKILNYSTENEYLVYTAFIDQDKIFSLLSDQSADAYSIVVLNESDRIVCCSDADLTGQDVSAFARSIGYDGDLLALDNNSVTEIGKESYLYKMAAIDDGSLSIRNWKIVYLLPADAILSGRNQIWVSSLIVCLLCFMASVALILLISNNITSRIHRIIHEMKSVMGGRLDIVVPVTGKDEIGVIESNFNDMLQRINALITKVHEDDLTIKDIEIKNQKAQKMMMEAEIISLQSQINPHYLFNTLETIRMELVVKKQRRLAEIVKAFAEGFRTYIQNDQGVHPLHQEIRILQNFIKIQEFRYGDRMAFQIRIDENARDGLVPKLTLQPLVENAVFHGIEPKPEGGRVEIHVFRQEDRLLAEVFDDGVGIDEKDLKALNEIIYRTEDDSGTESPGRYYALKNVHNRIVLLFGPDFGLTLESVKNEFTRVRLVMPFLSGVDPKVLLPDPPAGF
jgi:two-component system, sensor histidine kinase YesM